MVILHDQISIISMPKSLHAFWDRYLFFMAYPQRYEVWSSFEVCINWLVRHTCTNNWAVTWDFQQCGMCDQQRLRPACAYAQSDQSLCLSLECSISVKLPTDHHLMFLILTGGCTGSSESSNVKMPLCWKSRVAAPICLVLSRQFSFTLGSSDR